MSTVFAIVKTKYNDKSYSEGKRTLEIARRYGIGDNKVAIHWLDFSLKELLEVLNIEFFNSVGYRHIDLLDIEVEPIDNTAQGVKTIRDLVTLDKHGTLKEIK
tara:strand:- start:1048 stop:1356 length:309 start_codon:yes stop_codon:yes gene_type:complete